MNSLCFYGKQRENQVHEVGWKVGYLNRSFERNYIIEIQSHYTKHLRPWCPVPGSIREGLRPWPERAKTCHKSTTATNTKANE